MTTSNEHNNAPAVPQGWKLVQTPIAEEMHVAAVKVLLQAPGLAGLPQRMLDAMLAATPVPAPAQERCQTCGEDEPHTGACGTSDSDTKALCKRAPAPAPAPAAPNDCLHIIQDGRCMDCGVPEAADECIPDSHAVLVAALDKIVEAHKFNVTAMVPADVHAIAFEALTEYTRLMDSPSPAPAQEVVMPTDKQIIQAMTAEFPTPSLVPMLKGSTICGDFHKALVSAVNVGIAEFCRINGIGQPAQEVASAFTKALDIRLAQGWNLTGNAIPVLYTDTINDYQVRRDDVWLCTTDALKTKHDVVTDDWSECKRISELPEVDEALRLFAEGETSEDQAVAIVQSVAQALRAKGGK